MAVTGSAVVAALWSWTHVCACLAKGQACAEPPVQETIFCEAPSRARHPWAMGWIETRMGLHHAASARKRLATGFQRVTIQERRRRRSGAQCEDLDIASPCIGQACKAWSRRATRGPLSFPFRPALTLARLASRRAAFRMALIGLSQEGFRGPIPSFAFVPLC